MIFFAKPYYLKLLLPNNSFVLLILLITSILFCTQARLANASTAVIANERSGDLVFMDDSGKTTDVVPLCARPRGMTQNKKSGSLFIACSDDGEVVEFDLNSKKIVRVFSNLPGAMSLATHEASSRLVISNEGSASVTVLSTDSGEELAVLPTGHEPDGVALTADGGKIFVASENAGIVHVFDGQTYAPIKRIITSLRPRRLAIRGNELWVSSEMGSRVELFDIDTLTKIDEIIFTARGFRIEQLTPVDILFDPDQSTAFVALGSANHVAIVDAEAREILKYILVGRRPWGLGITDDGEHLFVLNGLSDDVTIIDIEAQRPVRTSRAGLVPHSVEILE